MKHSILKYSLLSCIASLALTSCVSDDDFITPPLQSPIYSESFQTVVNNQVLELENWTNVSQAGNVKWIGKTFSGNGYAEFTTFGSSDASNIGWLVSPEIALDSNVGKRLVFQTAQHHWNNAANTFQVFISTDFDGDVTAATWSELTDATLVTQDIDWYEFVNSGPIDLSNIEGPFHVAFKGVGNGSTLTAGFQVDNVTVYSENN
ncbi:MAG: choice-of-anchor J domain-containing protein [Flavobacterium sp.]|nr:choice-of-anchor J domain-containing protein [Flavobacterium sp.]